MMPGCPITAAQDALTLLQTGRAGMAVRILEQLPDAIQAQLVEARGSGFAEGWDAHLMAVARAEAEVRVKAPAAAQAVETPPAPRKPSRLEWLREALADPARRELARDALRMDDRLLDRVAVGLATLSGTHWRKLREALA